MENFPPLVELKVEEKVEKTVEEQLETKIQAESSDFSEYATEDIVYVHVPVNMAQEVLKMLISKVNTKIQISTY